MCGIAGALITKSSDVNFDLIPLVGRMIGAILHRGPDDSGVYSQGGVTLGHARLSVIDLSAAGHQPMMTDDGQVRIVFNGEIYNFKELRAQLAEKGYHFKSHTDTEVILNGYHYWGKEVFSHLRGMFAIALWDARSDELILARDRVGVKPLFYAWDEAYFLHCEDLDWCMRFRKRGWKILFVPDAPVLHHQGHCSRARPFFVEWHKHKGMMRFYYKFFRHQYPGVLMWMVNLGIWLRFVVVVAYCQVQLIRRKI
jgi:asparagine synthase (glutamine-hydrolysing)